MMRRVHDVTTQETDQRPSVVPALVVAAAGLSVYVLTLAPTFLWSDSAKLALYVHRRVFTGIGSELHGIHPLHSVLGWLFARLPWPLAYTQNLMSAVFAAAALGLLFRIVERLTGDRIAALLAAGGLAVSQMFWLYAVINETYSLVAFTLTALLHAAIRWRDTRRYRWLVWFAFLAGSGFANHSMTVIFMPGLLVLLWNADLLAFAATPRLALAVIAALLGAAPVLLLPMLDGHSFATILRALIGTSTYHYQTFGEGSKLLQELVRFPLYLLYQFPTVGIPLALYGAIRSVATRLPLLVGSLLIAGAVVVFAAQYFLQRQFAMMIPAFVLVALWSGLGAAALRVRLAMSPSIATASTMLVLVTILAPPPIYRVASSVVTHVSLAPKVRTLPYRDSMRYFLFPPKGAETGARDYAEDAFRQATRRAIIITDFNPGQALYFAQEVLGQRPDISIEQPIDGWVHDGVAAEYGLLPYLRERIATGRDVYLADDYEPYYHAEAVRREFSLRQLGGPLWKVERLAPESRSLVDPAR